MHRLTVWTCGVGLGAIVWVAWQAGRGDVIAAIVCGVVLAAGYRAATWLIGGWWE